VGEDIMEVGRGMHFIRIEIGMTTTTESLAI